MKRNQSDKFTESVYQSPKSYENYPAKQKLFVLWKTILLSMFVALPLGQIIAWLYWIYDCRYSFVEEGPEETASLLAGILIRYLLLPLIAFPIFSIIFGYFCVVKKIALRWLIITPLLAIIVGALRYLLIVK